MPEDPGCGLHRLAAVLGVPAGRGVRTGGGQRGGAGRAGTGEEPLQAAGRLADWAIGLGLEPVPAVLLHPSVTERFAAHAPGLTG